MGPRWQTSQLWLDLDPQYTLILTHQQAEWHTQRRHDSSKVGHQRPKTGWWPNSWKSLPLPRNIWNNPPTHQPMKQPIKANHATFWDHSHLLRWPTVRLWKCFSLNKSTLTYHFVSHFVLRMHRCDSLERLLGAEASRSSRRSSREGETKRLGKASSVDKDPESRTAQLMESGEKSDGRV